jgi:anti-sigma factor ChrR (cupin superfamily)
MGAWRRIHTEATDELRELASLYVLDAMPPDQKAVYEAHLESGCAVCTSEVAALRDVTGAIAMSVEPVSPRAELRARLMSALTATSQPHAEKVPGVLYDKDGVLVARHSEMEWKTGELPGIFQKILFNDTARGFSTAMVRMTPGTHYPSHKHAGVEELYLLEGDLCVGDVAMREGDYCRGETGSIHEELVTRTGCLFVVTSSHHDQLLV